MKPLGPEEARLFELNMREGEGDDLTTLQDISPDVIAQVLARRLQQDRMYTAIGPVLVAVNPYKAISAGGLDIYDERVAYHYHRHSSLEVAPHVYRVASEAYKDLQAKGRPQCVIITGESGAGKTETAKVVMRFLSAVTSTSTSASTATSGALVDVKAYLLGSSCIFEAMGNAQTIRNDNSSRFGKYMEILIDFKGEVVGGRVTQYLLEKARVVRQNPGERSYHVFYQMLAGASEEERARWRLRRAGQGGKGYAFLMGEERRIAHVDDAADFQRLKASMAALGIADSDREDLFRLLSAILLLGDVEFEDHGPDERATIANMQTLEDVAELLGVHEVPLEWALTSSVLPSATKTQSIRRRVMDRAGSMFLRDSLCKEIYKRLFDFLVNKVNSGIGYSGGHTAKSIGLLDIYGFEIFPDNSFEQLCINFVNERLQQHFIAQCVEAEQREYEAEGLQWTHITFFDNKVVCDAIEKKPNGIFEVLDMQCTFKEATPEQLLASLCKSSAANNRFMSPQDMLKARITAGTNMFGIRHYAGDVVYTVDAFLDKNRDTLTQDLLTLMEASATPLAALLFTDERSPEERAKRPPTISTQFRRQVDQLMTSLKSCQPHYIRCVKPNDKKLPASLDPQRVAHQVQYLGLMENIRVRRSGFCHRQKTGDFVARYAFTCAESWEALTRKAASTHQEQGTQVRLLLSSGAPKAWSRSLASVKPLRFKEGANFVLGKSMVFIKDPATLHRLEERRALLLPAIATSIQARWRAYAQRRRYLRALGAATTIEAQSRGVLQRLRFRRMRWAALVAQRAVRMFLAKRRVSAIRRQFKNRPPRFWANRLQRVFRGHRLRLGLDEPTYAAARAIGARIEVARRRTRASARLGTWWRGRVCARRFGKIRRGLVKIQAGARGLLAKGERRRREAEDLRETEGALRKGLKADKLDAKGAKARPKLLRLSSDGSRVVWQSPFWASKEGVLFAKVRLVGPAQGTRVEVRCADRSYVFDAHSARLQASLVRFVKARAKASGLAS